MNLRGSIDPIFSQSTEFRTYRTAIESKKLNLPYDDCEDCVEQARKARFRNMNANLYDKTTPNALPGIAQYDYLSDYGVHYNKNYAHYNDDTM
jgi:hypothetical protein